ncbi:hypothetical protein CLOM_g14157 [Closterium sp. NIES-68]|nr:hypothetical protein CLOM_g14157 [Closterium sp. NIES-68]GJP80597.1 hypothetical protein CLOP_g10799 [Closterium sp. NIES-67]
MAETQDVMMLCVHMDNKRPGSFQSTPGVTPGTVSTSQANQIPGTSRSRGEGPRQEVVSNANQTTSRRGSFELQNEDRLGFSSLSGAAAFQQGKGSADPHSDPWWSA